MTDHLQIENRIPLRTWIIGSAVAVPILWWYPTGLIEVGDRALVALLMPELVIGRRGHPRCCLRCVGDV
jgi:hypothetical protein